METFNAVTLSNFLQYCMRNDMTRAIHRRMALTLFRDSMDDSGAFSMSYEEYDKIATYLQLPDEVVKHHSSGTAVYAFTRQVDTIRRRLKSNELTPGTSVASSVAGT